MKSHLLKATEQPTKAAEEIKPVEKKLLTAEEKPKEEKPSSKYNNTTNQPGKYLAKSYVGISV